MYFFVFYFVLLSICSFITLPTDVAAASYILYLCLYVFYCKNTVYVFARPNFGSFLNSVNIFFKNNLLYLSFLNCQIKSTLVWKPLFKKTSYFGLYRNSKTNIQQIKNK